MCGAMQQPRPRMLSTPCLIHPPHSPPIPFLGRNNNTHTFPMKMGATGCLGHGVADAYRGEALLVDLMPLCVSVSLFLHNGMRGMT